MNLNEVKKHVKFDIIFTLLVCIGVATCLLLTLAYIFRPINASASTLNETNITNAIQSNINCNGGSFCYTNYYYPYSYGTGYINTNTNPLVSFEFSLSSSYIQPNAPTTITITTSSNLSNVNYSCTITSYSSVNVPCNVVRTSNSSLNINFTTLSSATGYGVLVSTGPSSMITLDNNGNGNFKITYVNLLQTIGSDNLDIIENNNQNTLSIIDNQTSNTNDIINSQFENAQSIIENINYQLLNCSRNIMESSWVLYTDNMWQAGNDFQQQTADTANLLNFRLNAYRDNLYLTSLVGEAIITNGRRYYRFYNDGSFNRINIKANGNIRDTGVMIDVSSLPTGAYYYFSLNFVNVNQGYFQWRDLMISPQRNEFVQWGAQICDGNKLDSIDEGIGHVSAGIHDLQDINEQIQDIQQDTYDFLSDDTQPVPDNSELTSALGLVSVADPLSYLLTSPLSLLNQINLALNGNCQDYDVGAFGAIGGVDFSNYHFKFKCIEPARYLGNDLWTTIDIIMGIGLLVLTIYKFYHAISNILSMGAENEVERQFHYLTPMAFLASIIGNAGVGGVSEYIKGGGN